MLRVRPEHFEEYRRLHAAVWPGVLATIHRHNLRNFSIYHKDGWLFSYYEYAGSDYTADMAAIAADPVTQEWWSVVGPMQEPLETRAPGEWWAEMEEVFHVD